MAANGYKLAVYYDGYDTKKCLESFIVFLNAGASNHAYTDLVCSSYTKLHNTNPTKDGYTFVGWGQYINDNLSIISESATFNDLTSVPDETTVTDGTYCIYAVWKKNLTLSPTYGSEMYYVYEDELIAIADAIRAKTGSTDKIMFLSGFADELKKLKG